MVVGRYTRWFWGLLATVANALEGIPARSAIIDAEL
jgi:hypothetical protein